MDPESDLTSQGGGFQPEDWELTDNCWLGAFDVYDMGLDRFDLKLLECEDLPSK